MLCEQFFRKIIKEQINKGKKDFIIFPYGTNGMNLKRCLEECFSIKPVMLIDNEYSKYNPKIMNFEYLKQNYRDNMTVFLTIEDISENKKLQEKLLSFIDKNQLVNVIEVMESPEKKTIYEGDFLEKIALDYFIPGFHYTTPRRDVKNKKVKIRLYHSEYLYWNSIKTICNAFQEDEKYDVLIILNSHGDLEKEQMEREDCPFIMFSEYDVKSDMPDVLILSNLWDISHITNCRKYTKLIVAAPLSIIRYSYSLSDFWKSIRKGFGHYHPDYYLFDSLLYEEIKGSIYYSEKIIEMGNAKFDGIYKKSIEEKTYLGEWKKLKGKKVILWACDHGIIDGKINNFITFDLYAKTIFKYALEHPDIGFIMRFHRGFVFEMLINNCWTQEDVDILHDYCRNTPNIVWDESDSYDVAYSIADAILTDVLCGIICSALPTLKPICAMYRNHEVRSLHPELTNCYYSVYNDKDLVTFFDMVSRGDDPMYDLRVKASQKYVKHFDGKNGERIKDFIEEKYFELDGKF